jgi:hypothetical protein
MIMVVVVLHRLLQVGVTGDAAALCVASEKEQSYVRNAGYTRQLQNQNSDSCIRTSCSNLTHSEGTT